jgi:hypothetical protein
MVNMSWDEYVKHQKEGWVNFKIVFKQPCLHYGKYYYNPSDKTIRCRMCKEIIKN